ncbi:DUF2357 domain-containing protein [bacterium]|nr:DUF2357 domain-containing protein [bacterium]
MISLSSISLLLSESADLYLTIANPELNDPLEGIGVVDGLRLGDRGRIATDESKSPISYDPEAQSRGRQALTLRETKTYFVAVHKGDGLPCPELSREDVNCSLLADVAQQRSARMTSWRLRKTNGLLSGEFRLVNYIGVAWIEVKGFPRIKFDVAPEKFDYETEYRAMVESIAEKCQQLLLEWNSPTSLTFRPDPTVEKRMLLEQFLFLRHCLGADRLDLYLEILRRNPHRALYDEADWQDQVVSDRFFQDPLRYGRDWTPSGQPAAAPFGGFLPREVQCVSRRETLDTPPNRFVKFALSYFREICQAVVDHKKIQGAARDEALAMRESLDSFLSQRWLLEIGDLQQVPLNNQTLLKREGYRQVLEAWFLADVAAQLDWEGREDAYDGNNRDVATLYEFWLYFEIFDLLRTESGCHLVSEKHHIDGDEGSFLRFSDRGGLGVSLKQGKTSRSRFVFQTNEGATSRLHFYYNRSFSQEDKVLKTGTYSRTLCPDYTLVVFPEEIACAHKSPEAAEREAESRGQITYLHFDAKYRINSVTEAFGEGGREEAEEEKREAKVTKTYQRGDLYKMHTYNEAIRRTVGSYVLYPGDTDQTNRHKFPKYHEVLPGVGAFALRPGYRDDQPVCRGRIPFAKFLTDVVRHQGNEFSQLRRISSLTHETIKEKPLNLESSGQEFSLGSPSTPVILGFVGEDREEEFKNGRYFYCWATNSRGAPARVDLAMATNALFVGYAGSFTHRRSLSWCAGIASCRIVTPLQLRDHIEREPSGDASLYLLFLLDQPTSMRIRDLNGIAPHGGGLAISAEWGSIAKAPLLQEG